MHTSERPGKSCEDCCAVWAILWSVSVYVCYSERFAGKPVCSVISNLPSKRVVCHSHVAPSTTGRSFVSTVPILADTRRRASGCQGGYFVAGSAFCASAGSRLKLS